MRFTACSYTHPHTDEKWLQDGGHSALLIAVLGTVSDHDHAVLVRMRHSAAAAMAFALDVPAWGRGHTGAGAPVPWLTSHGWRAVSAGPKDPVPRAWQELGLLGRTRSDAAAGAPLVGPVGGPTGPVAHTVASEAVS